MSEKLNPIDQIQRLAALDKEERPSWAVIGEVLSVLEGPGVLNETGIPWPRQIIQKLSEDAKIKIGPNQLRKSQRVLSVYSEARLRSENKLLVGKVFLKIALPLWK